LPIGLYDVYGKVRLTASPGSGFVGSRAPDGSLYYTLVDGNTRVGLYAADGSINVVDDPSAIGKYHPCGALRLNSINTNPVKTTWAASSGSLPSWLSIAGGANRLKYNSSNVYESSAAPRFDYTFGAPSLLIEPASTNSLLQSRLGSVTGWTQTRSAISTGSLTGITGVANSAGKVTADATAANSHLIQQSRAFTSGNTYTFSCFAKPINDGSVEGLSLRFPSGQFGGTTPRVDFVLSGNGSTALPINVTNYGIVYNSETGWYRCWISSLCTSTASGNSVCYLQKNGTVTFDGDSTTAIGLDSVQVEPLAYPSSPIFTTTTAVSPTADVITAGATYQDNKARVYGRSILTRQPVSFDLTTLSEINTVAGYWIDHIDVY
jgi:hypothetical protein